MNKTKVKKASAKKTPLGRRTYSKEKQREAVFSPFPTFLKDTVQDDIDLGIWCQPYNVHIDGDISNAYNASEACDEHECRTSLPKRSLHLFPIGWKRVTLPFCATQ
jgi:hypothetical protein